MGSRHRCVDGCGCGTSCECGIWCADGSCGNTQGWQATHFGASDAGGCVDCGNLNVTTDHSDIGISMAAEAWNEARANFLSTNGVAMAGEDAKAGTRVCVWMTTSTPPNACGIAAWGVVQMAVYQGDDGKWHRYAAANLTDGILNKIGFFDGDVLLGGTGNQQDCGDPDSPATTITDVTLWTYKYVVGEGAIPEPTWAVCSPPAGSIWENIPGGAV